MARPSRRARAPSPVPVRYRLRLADALAARGWTVYRLVAEARAAGHRLTYSAAYRAAAGAGRGVTFVVLDACCAALGVEPGDLFERD